jgi:tRNA (adenine22-N1)-methyltransferase
MAIRELRLQPRLQCIADCVPDGARLADVGTDHGYLPVWLLCEDRIQYAIASDINALPLDHAKRTAAEYGVSERMEFRLCAGLDGYAAGETDTIVIAGMGGETILAILEAAPWLQNGSALLLLQPMTKAELLRGRLSGIGYRIDSERLVLDKGTIYTVLAVYAGQSEPLDAARRWCGVGLEHDPLYGEYARARIRKLEDAAAGMRYGKNTDKAAAAAMEADAAALRQAVKEWENANRTGC